MRDDWSRDAAVQTVSAELKKALTEQTMFFAALFTSLQDILLKLGNKNVSDPENLI